MVGSEVVLVGTSAGGGEATASHRGSHSAGNGLSEHLVAVS